jgi:uncharacterized protein (TIGR03435 family)
MALLTKYWAISLIGWTSVGLATAAPAEFEVASVKQLDKSIEPGSNDLSFLGTSGKPIKITGNRITITGTFRTLIAAAYDVKDYQVSGAPPWATSLVYAVTAKTEGDATPTQAQVRPMLQAVLADRFQLKVRHETKDVPVYHLTQVKKSANFKAAAADETFTWNVTPGTGGMMRSKATKESMLDFVQLVAVSTDRPVIDKTGVTGDIDYEILISQEGIRTPDDMNRAIVDAVKDQLGFKLEPAKDAIDLLVVERAEKASEN